MEIVSHPVKVLPLTEEQSKKINEYYNFTTGELPRLEKEQLISFPDVVKGKTFDQESKEKVLYSQAHSQQWGQNQEFQINKEGFIVQNTFNGDKNEWLVDLIKYEDVKYNPIRTMSQETLDYLKNSLKYLGFGENLNAALEVKLKAGPEKFTLGATALMDGPTEKDTMNYELRFSKSATTDKYFLNNYMATLEKGDQIFSRTFPLNRGTDITAKEAYNLLSGRSIQKKADVVDKLSIVADGKALEKVIDFKSAREKIAEAVKTGNYTSYTVVNKNGLPIKAYDKAGKESFADHKQFTVRADYENPQKQSIFKEAKDVAAGSRIVKGLTKEADIKSISFLVENQEFARFDKTGAEMDLTPNKEKQEIWMKLDLEAKTDKGEYPFKTFYQNYGFDLEKTLSQLPIKELNDPEKRGRLISSLNRGNIHAVTLEKSAGDEKAFIAANPQFKSISLYDKDMKLQYVENKVHQHAAEPDNQSYQRGR